MAKDVEFEVIAKVAEAVRRGVPVLKDEEVQISASGEGTGIRLGVAIETRLDPETREAVFAELRRIGCKNVEIKCDAADQLVFFIAVSSLMKLKSSSKADEEGSASV